MSRHLYADISEVTTLISPEVFEITHADNGETPGTGGVRGTFPGGCSFDFGMEVLLDVLGVMGITAVTQDNDGATAILGLDWRDGIARDRALSIIAEEGMDAAAIGHADCIIIRRDGALYSGGEVEPADLRSESLFREQVIRWREAYELTLPAPA